MRSSLFRPVMLIGLTVVLATACQTKPKQPDATESAAGSGQDATVAEKDMSFDPMGSDGGRIAGLNTVYFEFDQARLTADARKKLSDNASWIKSNPNVTVQIEGHTDERGSVEYNLSLGERRAKSVKSYLESLGVESRRMTIISYGEEKPVANGEGEDAWSKNRRANFVPLQ